jgi:hypothetical protein
MINFCSLYDLFLMKYLFFSCRLGTSAEREGLFAPACHRTTCS